MENWYCTAGRHSLVKFNFEDLDFIYKIKEE